MIDNEAAAIKAVETGNYVYENVSELSGVHTEIRNPKIWSERNLTISSYPKWY